MKRMIRKLAGAVLCLLLALQLIPAAQASVVQQTGYYGREALSAMPNATALLYAYDQIVAGVENCQESITVYNGTDTLSKEEFRMVLDVYVRDYPDHFWLAGRYQLGMRLDTVDSYYPQYLMTGQTLQNAKAAMEAAAEQILAKVKPGMSEYEKALVIHDAIAPMVVYTSGEHAHDAYGALIQGQAVCEGYAEAYSYVLRRAGIRSFLAKGSSINPGTGEPEGHEWLYVRIDGNYYHVDLTWDDQDSDLYHEYFCQSDAQILESHAIDSTAYPLPDCSSENAFYFHDKAEYLSSYSVKSVAELLVENDGEVHLYVSGDPVEFINWFLENAMGIAKQMKLTGSITGGYRMLSREVVLTLRSADAPVCAHQWVNATCTAPKTCSVCGKTKGDALGHTEVIDQAVAATCTAAGRTEGAHCSVCGDVLTAQTVIPAAGHSYQSVVTAPTCTADGYTTYTCAACGHSYIGDETPANGHSYETVTTLPTCTADGYTTYTCAACGHSDIGDETPAAGHSYQSVVTAPTCTADGYTTYTCAACGHHYIGDETPAMGHLFGGWYAAGDALERRDCENCSHYETRQQDHSHQYEPVITLPTCTADGYTTYTCNCGDSYVADERSATGHQYQSVTTPPTCAADGYTAYTCAACGHSYIGDETPANGHSYEAVTTPPTCDADGYTAYTCAACGHHYIGDETPANGHSYEAVTTPPTCAADGYTAYTCAACGDRYVDDTVVATGNHTYTQDVCAGCGGLHPSYLPLDLAEWTAEQVVNGTLYQIRINFKDAVLGSGYGVNVDELDAAFREMLMQDYAQGGDSVVLVDGAYYYVGMGDGGSITYTTEGKTVYVNCEDYLHLTIERTAKKQLTVVQTDMMGSPTGIILTACEDPAVGHDWVEATCQNPKTCAACGKTEGEKLEHRYGQWYEVNGTTEQRDCERCGEYETREVEIVPPAVPKAKVSGVSSTGKNKVSWNKVDGAVKYQVYRATSKSGSYTKIKTTTSTSYTDTSAKAGTKYYYKVRAVAEDGTKSSYSSVVSRTCDLARPEIEVKGVDSTGKNKISWDKISGAEEYKIYRATSKSGTYKLIKTTTSTSYTDSSAKAGTKYYYKVKAIHEKSSANSAYSEIVSRTCDLARPNVSIKLSKGDPKLSWSKISGAKQYKIYRATSKSGTYKLIKTTTSTSYTDSSAKAGKTYYYKVVAVHKTSAANSAYSLIDSIKAK